MPGRSPYRRRGGRNPATVPVGDVVRFTGRTRTELLDLVCAGALGQAPGRGRAELTAETLRDWMIATA